MWADKTLAAIRSAFQVEEFCICPGSRNAVLVNSLLEHNLDVRNHFFFDERSAGFFAIGRIISINGPVAVLTTSGTAVGELLPAVMEAFHSQLPLILITADLPRRFLGHGYPQGTDQAEIFASFVRARFDLSEDQELPEFASSGRFRQQGPVHINLRLEDPLRSASSDLGESRSELLTAELSSLEHCSELLRQAKAPVAIVSGLGETERDSVRQFLQSTRIPSYLEALSGLREDSTLSQLRIRDPNKLFMNAEALGFQPDLVLRIGTIPVHSFWRNLERRFVSAAVLSISSTALRGTARPHAFLCGDISEYLKAISKSLGEYQREPPTKILNYIHSQEQQIIELLETEKCSEPGVLRALSLKIPKDALLYLGNSLPIREWDLGADEQPNERKIRASRGLNGIDGQISTFLGMCSENRPNWGVFGDLTSLYDLSSPWVLNTEYLQRVGSPPQIVIVNNFGGRIFERMFPQPEFLNSHRLRFEKWAEFWSLDFITGEQLLSESLDLHVCTRPRVIELLPDKSATDRFWKRYQEIN